MAFSRTWNTAYEQSPADTDEAKQGALRMREIKNDVRERASIDHEWQDDAQGGFHKKVTLIEQAADPANASNLGVLYTKDLAGRTELFYIDDTGAVVQLSALGAIPQFPSGTRMFFQQAAAPTGWTIDATHDDKALRIVDGSGGVPGGGADAFTTVFAASKTTAAHTLTIAEMPAHTHAQTSAGQANNGVDQRNLGAVSNDGPSGAAQTLSDDVISTGGGGSHSHDLVLDLQYVDSIIAEKD